LLPGFPGWIDFHAGATLQAMGRLSAEDWLRGTVPWWNPYVGVGLPLGAELQAAPLFLPFVLLLRFFDGVMYLKIAMQLVAGLAACALFRTLGLGRLAALTGGALYALGGNFAWFSDVPILPPPFLPLLLLGIERARPAARAGRLGGCCCIAIAIGYLAVAGFPETAYFCGLYALGWSILRFAAQDTGRWRYAASVVLGGALGLLLAAPVLLAFFQYLPLSWPSPRPYAHASLLAANLPQLLFPYLYGPLHYRNQFDLWFHAGGFLGSGSVFVAIAGTVHAKRERALRILAAAWIVVCLAKSIDVPGITAAMNLLPVITATLFHRYITATLIFSLAVLVAFAIDDMRTQDWRYPVQRTLAALGVYSVLAVGGLGFARPQLAILRAAGGSALYPLISVAGAVALVLCLALLCARRPAARPVALLVIAESMILFAVPLLSGTPAGVLDLGPVQFLQANLGTSRFVGIGPITPNYSAYFGLRSVNFNYLPVDDAWARYAAAHISTSPRPDVFNGTMPDVATQARLLRQDPGAFTGLGVKYVVAYRWADPYDGARPADMPGIAVAYQDPQIRIYQLPDPAPYMAAPSCTVSMESIDRASGTCASPAALVRQELFFPGWRAALDGAGTAVERAGPLFQKVQLPAGPFTLTFDYAPPYATLGYALFALGAIGVVACAAAWLSRSRESPGSR
jgi:hypothetical protein